MARRRHISDVDMGESSLVDDPLESYIRGDYEPMDVAYPDDYLERKMSQAISPEAVTSGDSSIDELMEFAQGGATDAQIRAAIERSDAAQSGEDPGNTLTRLAKSIRGGMGYDSASDDYGVDGTDTHAMPYGLRTEAENASDVESRVSRFHDMASSRGAPARASAVDDYKNAFPEPPSMEKIQSKHKVLSFFRNPLYANAVVEPMVEQRREWENGLRRAMEEDYRRASENELASLAEGEMMVRGGISPDAAASARRGDIATFRAAPYLHSKTQDRSLKQTTASMEEIGRTERQGQHVANDALQAQKDREMRRELASLRLQNRAGGAARPRGGWTVDDIPNLLTAFYGEDLAYGQPQVVESSRQMLERAIMSGDQKHVEDFYKDAIRRQKAYALQASGVDAYAERSGIGTKAADAESDLQISLESTSEAIAAMNEFVSTFGEDAKASFRAGNLAIAMQEARGDRQKEAMLREIARTGGRVINQYMHRISGAAVSPTELDRLNRELGGMGIDLSNPSTWARADPIQFMNWLQREHRDTQIRMKSFRSRVGGSPRRRGMGATGGDTARQKSQPIDLNSNPDAQQEILNRLYGGK